MFRNYYNFLYLKEKIDIHSLVSHIKFMFYSLYDEYLKFYSLNLNINTQPEVSQGKPPLSIRFGKGYQILFHKSKKAKGSGSSQNSTSELQSYLTTTFEFVNSPDFDIL